MIQKTKNLKSELSTELDNILEYWSKNTIDQKNIFIGHQAAHSRDSFFAVGKVLNPITFTKEYEASHYSPTIKR